jgi:multidrug efflux system membrane fusion protein
MNRSILIAVLMTAGITAWMLSGTNNFSASANIEEPPVSVPAKTRHLSTVKVKQLKAQTVMQEVVVNGRTSPGRKVTLKADTRGKVKMIYKKRGANVQAGEAILYLEMDDREERLVQAKALLEQRRIEHRASLSLKDKGLRAESQMAEATTMLRMAESDLKSIESDIAKTTVKAPFDGVVDARMVEQGSYLALGDPIVSIVDIDPFLIVADLAEGEAARVKVGQKISAKTADGRKLQGLVRYISTEADTQSRTFHLEIEVANPTQERLLGITTEITIPINQVVAHKMTPALLSLNDAGEIGIKVVNDDNIVMFYPAVIARSDSDGIWVSGMPESINLITVGQGFVRAGDHVQTSMQP